MLPVAMQSSVTSVLPTPTTDLTSQLWQLLQFGSVYITEKICKRMNSAFLSQYIHSLMNWFLYSDSCSLRKENMLWQVIMPT